MGWLSTAKVSQDTDLLVNILKENFAELIYAQFSYSVSSSQTPVSFKCVNITPIFTSKSRNHKNNYRLVTIIPLVSKIFEKIMKKQLSIYLENILSKFPCGFRKGLSTQHCLDAPKLGKRENGKCNWLVHLKHSIVYAIIC